MSAGKILMASERIAIIGSTGQLGSDLVEVLGQDDAFEIVPLSHQECDSTNRDQLREVLLKSRPDTVMNCAAYVRVDDCEDQTEEAFRVNALGALNVARTCAELDALCIYVSTDYVFDGTKSTPYVESDPTCPVNVYGASKLAGEHLVRQAAPRCLIVRMASLFGKTGARGKGGNFIETVIGKAKAGAPLQVVDDITMSPTYARDAAEALAMILRKGVTGKLHVTNSGHCTWHAFAKEILALAGLKNEVVAVSSSQGRASRPKNSSLRSDRFFGLLNYELRPWQDALAAYMVEKGQAPLLQRERKQL